MIQSSTGVHLFESNYCFRFFLFFLFKSFWGIATPVSPYRVLPADFVTQQKIDVLYNKELETQTQVRLLSLNTLVYSNDRNITYSTNNSIWIKYCTSVSLRQLLF